MTWHFISTLGLSFKLFHTHKESETEDESEEIHPAVSASATAAEGCSQGRALKYSEMFFAPGV